MRHPYALLVVFSIALTAAATDSTATRLSLSFTPATVVVSGGSSHRIVLFGIGISSFGRAPLLTREVLNKTSGTDGVVTFTPQEIPAHSVWVAVDVKAGTHVVGSPSGTLPPVLEVRENQWLLGSTRVEIEREYLEVLIVRPEKGGWTIRGNDGGAYDADATNDGILTVRVGDMDRVADEAAADEPQSAIARDLLVVIDPHTLQYFIREAR